MTVYPKQHLNGSRYLKIGSAHSSSSINSIDDLTGIHTHFDRNILYIAPEMTANKMRYFKHIFAGSERIATKQGGEPCGTKGGGIPLVPVEAPPINDSLVMNTQSMPSPPPVSIRDSLWSTYLNQTANCLGVQRQNLLLDFRINSLEPRTTPQNENTTYFYHPDHLGSTGYLSTHLQNGHARITQHYQYTPFGEAFVHQKYWQNTAQFNHQNPYEFNGKEKDLETGYNYYGARHYNSSWGIWLSVDPLADHPNQVDKSPYAAFWNNPVKYNDPDGRCPECNENIKDPKIGQIYYTEGGHEYTFGNDGWTRNGGELPLVEIIGERIPIPQPKKQSATSSNQSTIKTTRTPSTESAPWVKTALNEYNAGVKEVPKGSNAGPKVDVYLEYAGLPSPNQWCAAFVHWSLGQNKIKGAGGRGSDYLNWGVELKSPVYGAIAIFKTNHVGFYLGAYPDGSLKIIHGNWSDKISISNGYDRVLSSQIKEYRFPY